MVKNKNIKDIAKMAGVSVATVSHVLNKTRYVSQDLTAKVLKVIEEVDYHPNLVARGLRGKKTQTVGLIVPDIQNPLYAEMAKTIENLLFSHDITLSLCNSEHLLAKEKDYINALRAKLVDGLIIIPASEEADHINQVMESGLPVLVLDRPLSRLKVDRVLIDHNQGAKDAVEYLLGLGHYRLAYLDKKYQLPHKAARLEGVYKALSAHGLARDALQRMECGVSLRDGAQAMSILLRGRARRPTAVFCFDDTIAMGAIRAITDQGLKVPEDISVIGFDDMSICSYTVPRLTTLHYPRLKMSEIACELLLKRIAGETEEEPAQVVLRPELVVRESTQALVEDSAGKGRQKRR